MTALLIDKTVEKIVKKKIHIARENQISFEQMKKIKSGELPPPGDDVKFVFLIPQGYRCVFTIEHHNNETKVRHLSVSVPVKSEAKSLKKKFPSPYCMNEIMKMYGFKNHFESGNLYIYEEKPMKAINVIEEIDLEQENQEFVDDLIAASDLIWKHTSKWGKNG